MFKDLNFLDIVEKEIVVKEKLFNNLNELELKLNNDDNCILYINIRSINANFAQLEILINNLPFKPFIVICVETWHVKHENFFSLSGYDMFYNNSSLNKADGVICFVLQDILHETEIIEVNRLKIINTTIYMTNGSTFDVSAIYRSHEMSKLEFINTLDTFFKQKKETINHYIFGDYNIDFMEYDYFTQLLLESASINGYLPGFQSVTRPSNNHRGGTCIDNVLIKTNSLDSNTYI